MAHDRDIQNTLGGTEFGSSLKDLKDGDLGRGYFNAEPEGNYEGSLDPSIVYDCSGPGLECERLEGGTLHDGFIEPDMNRARHGDLDEYGFLRRPENKSDVERN